MAKCPHCGQTIDPPPKRSRKCPHCRKPIELRGGRLLTPEDAEILDDKAATAEAKKRFREGRQSVARDIREAKKSGGVVTGFKPMVTEAECAVCQAVKNKVFPIKTCTAEMLPPYENCEYPDGCTAGVSTVMTKEYEDLLAATSPGDFPGPAKNLPEPGAVLYLSPKSNPGCLVALVALGITGLVMVGALIDIVVPRTTAACERVGPDRVRHGADVRNFRDEKVGRHGFTYNPGVPKNSLTSCFLARHSNASVRHARSAFTPQGASNECS